MTWEMLTSGYKLIEGPTIDLDRSLVFSDVLGGGVHRLGSDGSVTTIVPPAIHVPGLFALSVKRPGLVEDEGVTVMSLYSSQLRRFAVLSSLQLLLRVS